MEFSTSPPFPPAQVFLQQGQQASMNIPSSFGPSTAPEIADSTQQTQYSQTSAITSQAGETFVQNSKVSLLHPQAAGNSVDMKFVEHQM